MINDDSGEIPLEKKIYTLAEVEAMSDEEITANLKEIVKFRSTLEYGFDFMKEIMTSDYEFDIHNSIQKQLKFTDANFCIFAYVQLVRITKRY